MLKGMLIALVTLLALPGVVMAQSPAVTFDPVFACPQVTLSNGNLTVAASGLANNYFAPVNSAINSNSKVYFEFVMGPAYNDGSGNAIALGIYNQSLAWGCGNAAYPGVDTFGISYNPPGNVVFNSAFLATGWPLFEANGSVVSFAVDTVNNKLWLRVNGGNWNNDILANQNPATNTGGLSISTLAGSRITPTVDFRQNGGGSITGQFASTSWSFSAPAGFTQLTALPPLPTASAMSGTNTSGIGSTAANGISCRAAASACGGGMALNLITDLGATCNGVADDGWAFNYAAGVAFRAYQATHPGAPVALIIPSGANCLLKTCPTNSTFGGVQNLTIVATGATLTAVNSGNCTNYRGSITQPWTADKFQPNSIGDMCLTMTTPGAEANYPVGRIVVLAGQGVQPSSFPPNWANFEFLKVRTNTGGKLCFFTPVQNFYPGTGDPRSGVDMTNLNCSGNYCGGPGAVSLMVPEFGTYFHTIGGTWDFHSSGNAGVQWAGMLVVMDNMTWLGDPVFNQPNACWFPSFLGTWIANNSNFHRCNMEGDKEIDHQVFNNTIIDSITYQSPSMHSIAVNNGSNVNLVGSAPLMSCNNSLAHLAFGNTFGPQPVTFAGVNCQMTIGAAPFNGMTPGLNGLSYAGGGVFNYASSNLAAGFPDQWFATGSTLIMGLPSNAATADNFFTVTGWSSPLPPCGPNSCNQPVTINTTLAGGSLPPPGLGNVQWARDAARNMSCSGCFPVPGTDNAPSDLNFPAAQGKPLFSYLNRTYTCANNIPNVPGALDINVGGGDDIHVSGAWVTYSINVITADTNPSDISPQFAAGIGQEFNIATGATGFQSPGSNKVNLLIAGTRTFNPDGTITGTQSGDSLVGAAFANNTWMGGSGGFSSNAGSTITNGPANQCPVVQWIVQANR